MQNIYFPAPIRYFLLSMLLFGLGCSDESETKSPKGKIDPFAELTLDVAVPAGLGLTESWQLIIDEWMAQTAATVRIHEYDASANDQSLTKLLTRSKGLQELPTLFVVPVPRIAELAVDNAAAEISSEQQSQANLNYADLFEGLSGSTTLGSRRVTFIPVSSPVLVCYYRRDLLEAAGLTPPTTWTEYQNLLEKLGKWAPGLSAVEPWGEQYRATLFLARAVAFAKHPANISYCMSISNGEPLIDNPGFVRALETSRAALSKMPNQVREYTPAECRRELFSGKAAIGIAMETGPGNPLLPFGPASQNDIGPVDDTGSADGDSLQADHALTISCIRLPGSHEIYNTSLNDWESFKENINYSSLTGFGGLAIGVSSKSSKQQSLAAWNLIRILTIDNLPIAFPGPTKSVCRVSQVPDAPGWIGSDSGELAPETAISYIAAVEQSLQDAGLAFELPVAGREQFRSALTEELGKFLDAAPGSRSAQETLTKVAQRWREISAEIGPAKVHASHLRSLGLPAPN